MILIECMIEDHYIIVMFFWNTAVFLCIKVFLAPSECLCISLFLSSSLLQCLCGCNVRPYPATNWVSPSVSFFFLIATFHTRPSSLPCTLLHRCISVALSTAWSVPLSAGCMVVLIKAACNKWIGGQSGGNPLFIDLFTFLLKWL